jgi:hypothetical protein
MKYLCDDLIIPCNSNCYPSFFSSDAPLFSRHRFQKQQHESYIAINEKHYRENQRLLEGGLWCEATIGYNTIEDDDFTFFIEEMMP